MSELSQDARALIEEACSQDAPREADRERVRGKLIAALGVQALATASTGTNHVAATTLGSANESAMAKLLKASWWSKGALAASAAGVSAALYLATGGVTAPAHRARSVPAEVAAKATSAEAPVPTVTAIPAVRSEPLENALAVEPSRERTARRGKTSRTAHKRVSEPAVTNPGAAEPKALAAEPSESSLGAELALLARAERSLREGKPRDALKLATEYSERFGAGSLGEERDGVEVLARCMLGEAGQAGARAFLERAPGSPLAPRVRKECGLP